MTRQESFAAFAALWDAGFDVELHARRHPGMAPGEAFPLRVFVKPLNREQLDKLTSVLDPLELDFSADSLRSPFAGGVTFNIFPKGARSYAV